MSVRCDHRVGLSYLVGAKAFVPIVVRRTLVCLGFVAMAACTDSGSRQSGFSPQSAVVDIEFTVTDVTSAPIVGADVTLTSTSASYRRLTDADGSATFQNVAAGDWNVSVSATGFEPQTSEHTILSDPRSQGWGFFLEAVGAWDVGRAIVLGTRMVDLADDGSAMTFEADIAVVGENSVANESLSAAEFSLVTFDCGWGGPRECASDAEGNATGTFYPDGEVEFLGLQPPSDRHAYLVGVLVERSEAVDDWDDRGPALKAFFGALGGNDTASLASVEKIEGSATLTVHGPFTNDGSIYLDAIDQLAEPAGSPPEMLDSLIQAIELAAADDGLGNPAAERNVLVLAAHQIIPVAEVDIATELAVDLNVRISTVHNDNFGFPEMAVRSGGFAVDIDESRQLGIIFGALDRILGGTLPYYRMRFRIVGSPHTFVSGGNAKAFLRIQVPTPFPSLGIYTSVDVAIP